MKNAELPSKKNQLFNAVDRAPFAGKFFIKDSYVNYITASDEKKTRNAITATTVLSLMVAAHAYQAKMGFDSLIIHAPAAAEDTKLKDIIFASVDGVYMFAMSAVTLRQADLMRKVGTGYANWIKTHKQVPEMERKVEKRDYVHKKFAIGLAAAVTLAGQAAEMVSYTDASMQEYQDNRSRHVDSIRFNPGLHEADTINFSLDDQVAMGYIVSSDKNTESTSNSTPGKYALPELSSRFLLK